MLKGGNIGLELFFLQSTSRASYIFKCSFLQKGDLQYIPRCVLIQAHSTLGAAFLGPWTEVRKAAPTPQVEKRNGFLEEITMDTEFTATLFIQQQTFGQELRSQGAYQGVIF